jgi:hypothetical protein
MIAFYNYNVITKINNLSFRSSVYAFFMAGLNSQDLFLADLRGLSGMPYEILHFMSFQLLSEPSLLMRK